MRQKSPSHPASAACPCGSSAVYANCCGRYHALTTGGPPAPTPESLMRSRYSAYVIGLIDYLLATWHASTAPGELTLPPVKWLGLEVLASDATADAGVVEFTARCRDGGRAQRLHETSRFVREAGQWYYIDGDIHTEE